MSSKNKGDPNIPGNVKNTGKIKINVYYAIY